MNALSLQEYLSAPYRGASSFLDNVLFPIFGKERFEGLYETEFLEKTGYKSTPATGISSIKAIGELRIGIEPLRIFDVTVEESVRMERNRVNIQRLVRRLMEYHSCAFILFHYDTPQHTDWRFSYCHKEGNERAVSDTRRYTFLLGPGQSCRTASENFMALYAKREQLEVKDIETAFSVEALTRAFYAELLGWYDWARNPATGVTFPNNVMHPDDDRDGLDLQLIRLITRLMFVWFIKEKGLVPPTLFNEAALQAVLKDFHPLARDSSQYYQAILQNLFFATLNREITDEAGNPNRGFAERVNKRDIKTLYRYDEQFAISKEEVITLFAQVPFLNGGLFECLDKTKEFDGEEVAFNIDGFSRNATTFPNGAPRQRAFVPNELFFAKREENAHEGLFSILSRYNFTVEENTPHDQQVALDPELLGKVFENLLGTYNPETQESARKQKGAFYTPREVVNYMVDRSLCAALGENDPLVKALFDDTNDLAAYTATERAALAAKIRALRILDPACGSGAFPMGMLGRMTDLLQRLEPASDLYALKLELIEHCIYGVDIEPIAVQITKLRFFISLICDCERRSDRPEENYGIPPLPNLETKFVAANTLLRPKQPEEGFRNQAVEVLKAQLTSVRHDHFRAKTAVEKKHLRQEDQRIREALLAVLGQTSVWSSDEARQLVSWSPYDQNASALFFDPQWMFDLGEGVDVVIGNPPYVQLQKMQTQTDVLKAQGYQTFDRTGDLYCLFYERGWQLLKEGGHLCYITSNKWMRAGYGEKMRSFFAKKTNPMLLIDFAGVKIFESATVDTNILLFSKSSNQHKTICAVADKKNKNGVKNLSLFVQQQHLTCDFRASESWVILSPIEQSIKRKIEAVGTPLKDWDVQIYRGVLTGCNEAFIINTAKRDEILANCQSEAERARTAELIRPILRGRDIGRYGYKWAGLWLIYIPWHFPFQFDESIQGASEKAERAFKEQYPAVYSHMLQYKEPLSKRNKAETGIRYEWYAMQRWGAKYWNLFFQPHICWKAVGKNLAFALVEGGIFLTAPASFISGGNYNETILHYLCSTVGSYFIYKNSDTTGAGDIMLNIQSLIKFPIPIGTIDTDGLSNKEINEKIYRSYGFTHAEISYIESQV